MINKLLQNFKKTLMSFKEFIPLLISILLMVSILKGFLVFEVIGNYLNNNFLSVFISDIFGGISAGSAINSYIIANSFGDFKSYFLVITSFLISWITVGIIQIPAEIYFFGKKFAIIRNLLSFIFAIIGAYIIYFFYYL